MLSLLLGVFPDKLQADLGLAHAHAIGEQHPSVVLQDALCPGKPIPLEGSEGVQLSRRRHIVQFSVVKLQQRAEEDGLRVALQKRRPQQVQQPPAEVIGVVPEALMPLQGHSNHIGLVVHHPQLKVGGQAALGEVGRRHQRSARSSGQP